MSESFQKYLEVQYFGVFLDLFLFYKFLVRVQMRAHPSQIKILHRS